MKIPFLEIANRLTGISTPIFGVSWNPPILEVDVANRLITFLEDRRALYEPLNAQTHFYVPQSILKIREELTTELKQLDRSSSLALSLKAMQSACRKYLTETERIKQRQENEFLNQMILSSILGELRGVFGIHIAQIAVQYGIDVDDNLTTIFPVSQ